MKKSVISFCLFWFSEYKDKFDIVDDNEADTIEYDYRNKYFFRPDKSGPGLTGNEYVVMPHPLILGMALAVNVDREDLLPFIRAAMDGLLHHPKDMFYRGRLWDILYDGIVLDCSSEDFEVTALCSEFSGGDIKEVKPLNETAYVFSLFGNVCFYYYFHCHFKSRRINQISFDDFTDKRIEHRPI